MGSIAQPRINMPHVESFSQTFDRNRDTLSYLLGTWRRRRPPRHHEIMFWPFFFSCSCWGYLFLFPSNVEMLRCCWNVQGPSVFLAGSKVPSPIIIWRYAIILHKNSHMEIRHNLWSSDTLRVSTRFWRATQLWHVQFSTKFQRATQLWHVCFTAKFSQVFLVPPNCDTSVSTVKTWSKKSSMGTVFVPQLFTLKSKFVMIVSVFTEWITSL